MKLSILSLALLFVACKKSPEPSDRTTPDTSDTTTQSHTGAVTTDTAPTGTTSDTGTLPSAISFQGAAPKNVLVISIDTLRRDKLDAEHMPYLYSLAEQSLWLQQHITCANWTLAGTTCTATGAYNIDAGFLAEMTKEDRVPLPDNTPTQASTLRDQGYTTTLVSTNGFFGTDFNNNTQGFDEVFVIGDEVAGVPLSLGRDRILAAQSAGASSWYAHIHLKDPHHPYVAPDSYLTGLQTLDPSPFDLTLGTTFDYIHAFWDDISPEDQQIIIDHVAVRYDGAIRFMDDQIKAAMEQFEADGILDDTLVVFWTDHGESFWEYDGLQGHGLTAHWEENDGIALFWSKNINPVVWTGPTSSVDITPTVLDALGYPVPTAMTGVPVGHRPEDGPRYTDSAGFFGPIQSVRLNDQKLVYWWYDTMEPYDRTGAPMVQFFDRSVDPSEKLNLYDPTDPDVLKLWTLLKPRVELAATLAPHHNLQWVPELP